MARRKILSLGMTIPTDEVERLEFDSNRTLVDADIVILCPRTEDIHYERESPLYNGKPVITKEYSFAIRNHIKHWQTEIETALRQGKTIFVFLVEPQQFYVYTGEIQVAGTAKSQRDQHIVAPFDTYAILPLGLDYVPNHGTTIVPSKDAQIILPYWNNFAELSSYEVYLTGKFSKTLLTAKDKSRIVGAILQVGTGSLVLLPSLNIDSDEYLDDDDDGNEFWTPEGVSLGNRLINALVEIDKVVRSNIEATPQPEWLTEIRYQSEQELELEKEIDQICDQIVELEEKRRALISEQEREGYLKHLLYESGHQLENVIIDTLNLLGFTASRFEGATSEFDAVFLSSEGRFIGEAEGKDNSALHVEKIRQLRTNLDEDFAKEETTIYAKGVLFGNAYRLTEPSSRGIFFTPKCVEIAQLAKIALVRTPDLYPIVRYLKHNSDEDFTRKCREAIKAAEGTIVEFPSIPVKAEINSEDHLKS
jgi:hypothetical protein